MRLLHTSDWHLGRGLGGHSLADGQQAALDWIVALAEQREVDAVIVAGDVFDRTFPAVEDVRRLNGTLTAIHAAGIPIIMTAGNHDEGARLAAFQNLLDDTVHVIGEYGQVGMSVALQDEHGPVLVYALPYLDPDGARRALATEPGTLLERSHEAVMAEAMRRIREDLAAWRAVDPGVRSVVIAHAFVVTGRESSEELRDEQCESERDITVGGVPSVPTGVFTGVDYVALGHLHGQRTVSAQGPVVHYSGSILRYSMSEARHEKSVTIVDLDADGRASLEVVPIPQGRGMARLEGSLDELCSDAHVGHVDDFVELTLTDARLPENAMARLQHRFSHIVSVRRRPVGVLDPAAAPARPSIHLVTPLETLENGYADLARREPSDAVRALLAEVLEEARAEA